MLETVDNNTDHPWRRFRSLWVGLIALWAMAATPVVLAQEESGDTDSTDNIAEPAVIEESDPKPAEPDAAPTDDTADPKPAASIAAVPDSSNAASPYPNIFEKAWLSRAVDFPVHGSIRTRYRYREAGDAADNDLFGTLAVDVGDPEKHWVTGHLMGRATLDTDGNRDNSGYYAFDSVTDTYDTRLNGKLYYGYLDVRRIPYIHLLRMGRQSIYKTPEFAYFDGIRLKTPALTPLHVELGAYFGVPTHLFEASPVGDLIYGGSVEVQPWTGGLLRADLMHLEDERLLGKYKNDLIGFGIWQKAWKYFQFHGLYTALEGKARDLRLRTTARHAEWDLMAQASFFALLTTQSRLAVEFDPFYNSLLERRPYQQLRFLVSKGLGEYFRIDAGLDTRWLTRDSDEGTYNREFQRYYLSPTVIDQPFQGSAASVTLDIWDSAGSDIVTFGLDLTQKIEELFPGIPLKVSAGTSYSLYKYDYYADRERDNVRVWYVKANYEITDAWSVRGQYELEDDGFEKYNTLRLTAKWQF